MMYTRGFIYEYRDRLRDGKLKTKIIKALEENLREHQGLKALQEKEGEKLLLIG